MCKSYAITHTCRHTLIFRLSTCSGSYTHTTRKNPKTPLPLCRSTPSWGFKSSYQCGPCCKASEEQRLEAEIAHLRQELADEPDWLMDAESGYESEIWRIQNAYPDGRFKKAAKPGEGLFNGQRKGGSKLREEVKVEDLPEPTPPLVESSSPSSTQSTWSSTGGGWDDWNWGEGWISLDEEIAQNEKARAEAGLPDLTTTSDAWDLNGWSDLPEPSEESEPAEPMRISTPSPPMRDDNVYIMDDSYDDEEDLFTFPQERFVAITAPVEEIAPTTTTSTYESAKPVEQRSSKKRSSPLDLAMQAAKDLKSLHGRGGCRWPMVSS